MKLRTKTILVTTVCTIAAMALGGATPLGQVIWPPKPMPTEPTGGQVALFMLSGLIEAIGFGLGVSFLAFGYSAVRRRFDSTAHAVAAFVGIGWILVSWFPHSNLHMFNGENIAGLIAIGYAFHISVLLAGVVLAYEVFRMRAMGTPQPTASHVRHAGSARSAASTGHR